MYYAYFVNTTTGQLKRVSEPWLSPPNEWRQISQDDFELYLLVIERANNRPYPLED